MAIFKLANISRFHLDESVKWQMLTNIAYVNNIAPSFRESYIEPVQRRVKNAYVIQNIQIYYNSMNTRYI